MSSRCRSLLYPSLLYPGAVLALSFAALRPSTAQSPTAAIPVPSLAELRTGFNNPPPAARLRCYWWWLNSNTDAATITHDLKEMKAKGYGGALLVDANGADQDGNAPVPPGPTFGSKEWTALYIHALREADRLGLEITLNIESGWNLGGPGVTPEHASKKLTWTRTQIKGGSQVTLSLPMPEIKNGYYRQVAVLAYPLAHGAVLAAQPVPDSTPDGRQPATVLRFPPSTERQSASVLRLRAAGASNGESGFSMPETSEMLVEEVAGDPAGAATYADTSEAAIQNLTSQVGADGTLSWHPPAGDWEVLRIGYTNGGSLPANKSDPAPTPDGRVSTSSGDWQGLAVDYLSRTAFESYWNQAVEPLLIAAKPFHSLKYLATDSWELGGTNWTDKFQEEFKALRGYDPVPWLPVVAGRMVSSRSESTRFLTDLRRTVADLVSSEHYDVFAEKARAYGLGLEAESGGPHGAPIDALETFRHSAVPQTEFWSPNPHRATDKERFFPKEAASAAHIYGQHFVAAEGETSIGPQWSESLAADLKPAFDMAITEGMNRLVWHTFTSSPASTGLPGQEYFAGTHLNPKVTWWEAGYPFFTYLNRAQYLMQSGLPVADVLYFYGDNVPNFVRLKSDDPAHVLPGYDYDVTNQDALLRTIKLEDGRLRGPSGMEWRALALPTTGRFSLEVLERLDQYVTAGGTVIGLAPKSANGRKTQESQAAFSSLVGKMWGAGCTAGSSHAYGKGKIFCTTDSHSVLAAMKVLPDVSLGGEEQTVLKAESGSALDYIHQRIGDADLYFLRNGSNKASRHVITFRTAGKLPETWDLVTGTTSAAPGARLLQDGRAEVTLDLPPYGSSVLVFGKTLGHAGLPVPSAQTLDMQAAKPWTITFQPGRGAPKGQVGLSAFESWSQSSDPAVRYFSGTATYHATVMAPSTRTGDRVWLRFPDVREIGQVTINGKNAGSVWAKPLELRVDQFLKPGENKIDIQVTNLWPNRIIGDLQPAATERFTATNIKKYKADSPLLPSGLIGSPQWVVESK